MSLSVSIGARFESMIKDLVASGEYGSASEVIRAGLRLLLEQEELKQMRLRKLQEAIQAGDESPDAGPASVVMPRALERAKAGLQTKVKSLKK